MIFNYIINNFGEVLSKTAEHMQITLTAVLIAIIIGVPLGVVVSRSEKFGNGGKKIKDQPFLIDPLL